MSTVLLNETTHEATLPVGLATARAYPGRPGQIVRIEALRSGQPVPPPTVPPRRAPCSCPPTCSAKRW